MSLMTHFPTHSSDGEELLSRLYTLMLAARQQVTAKGKSGMTFKADNDARWPTRADNDAAWTTIEAAAARFQQSTRTIRRHISEGTLPAYRIGNGKSIRLLVSDVDKLARRIPTA